MAITCCICGKKQSGWIIDYPLATHLSDYRLCTKCNDVIVKFDNIQLDDDLSSEIDYLEGFNIEDSKVQTFVGQLVSLAENKVDPSYIDEIEEMIKQERIEKIKNIKLTSGYNFENYNIVKYLDFISSEVAFGLGLFKALFASISDTFGTESISLKKKLITVKDAAFTEFKNQAIDLGANAIIGIDIDYTMFGGSMVAVICSGTAVVVEPLTVGNCSEQHVQ